MTGCMNVIYSTAKNKNYALDCFVPRNDGVYERHLFYREKKVKCEIASVVKTPSQWRGCNVIASEAKQSQTQKCKLKVWKNYALDCFVPRNDGVYERHLFYCEKQVKCEIASVVKTPSAMTGMQRHCERSEAISNTEM